MKSIAQECLVLMRMMKKDIKKNAPSVAAGSLFSNLIKLI